MKNESHDTVTYKLICFLAFSDFQMHFPQRLAVFMCRRGATPAAGHRDSGRAGLVSGATGDAENAPLRQRDGIQQGTSARVRHPASSPVAG